MVILKTKVLVTGGSGFIGREIVKELLQKEFEVHILDIYDPKMEGVTFFKGSVLDREAISKAMFGCDYVIHMAAILGVSKATYEPVVCLDVNIFGTRNVLRCCAIHHVKKILFPSSSEVYGEPLKTPVTEDTALQPKSEYGVSKSVAEEYLKAYKKQHGLNYTIVRYFNVYGEQQTHSWVMSKFVNNALLDRPVQIYGEGSQVRAFCHVKEAARGTVLALLSEAANGHAINIGNNGQAITMKELAYKVLQATGSTKEPVFIPLEHSDRTKEREIFTRIPSTQKAKDLLGFEASVSVDEGIQMMLDYKRQNIHLVHRDVNDADAYKQMIDNNGK